MNIKRTNIEILIKYAGIGDDTKKKKIIHNFKEYANFLPFPTREPERATFSQGVERTIGELVRIISRTKLSEITDKEEILTKLTEKIVFEDEHNKPYFKEIFYGFIGTEDSGVRVFHPYAYHFIQFSATSEAKGEKEIAKFIRDIYFDDSEFAKYFSNYEDDNMFATLLLENMGKLEDEIYPKTYDVKIPTLSKLFKADFEFLASYKDVFLKEFPLLISYYYFQYLIQLSLKLDQRHKADYNSLTHIYWLLDYEPPSKSRRAYTSGYRLVADSNKNLLVNIVNLAYLNIIVGSNRSKTINEIKLELAPSQEEDLNAMLTEWIILYRSNFNLSLVDTTQLNFDELCSLMINSLKAGMQQATISRYSKSIESIGKKYFLKTRGSYGFTLNATQELVLLLIGVIVKDKRKHLKEVFIELEERGLFLDRFSQEEVVTMLDKLNLLDKKSDSGDAQYVKPIF